MFKKGEYIVTGVPPISTDCAKKDYCFKQREDQNYIQPEMDLKESRSNGNDKLGYTIPNFTWRYATHREIAEYEKIGKPFDITTLSKEEIINNYSIY